MIMFQNAILLVRPSWMTADMMVWVLAVPIVILLLAVLAYQVHRVRQLRSDLGQMANDSANIEYDLVLKAMKLSTWRIDVNTRALIVECDYRDGNDCYIPQQGASMEHVFKRISPEHAPEVRRRFADLVEGRAENIYVEYLMSNREGKQYWAAMFSTVERRDLEGRPLTLVGATMRIDQTKKVEEELLKARHHAEESDRLKTAFLANITHEVRTPLHAIVGFSDVLPLVQSDEERQNLIDLIKQNNAHLLRLFDDMMNVSKLEAGTADSIVKTEVGVLSVLREVADKYTSLCLEKGLTMVVDMQEEHTILTDRDRLKEIVNQYVNNAVKFTTTGEIRMGIMKGPTDVRVWVRDTGKGIPQESCNEHLFDRFVKVDEFVPGTGIGLSICRNLADNLGASVGVDSTMGKGSMFWVSFPRKKHQKENLSEKTA